MNQNKGGKYSICCVTCNWRFFFVLHPANGTVNILANSPPLRESYLAIFIIVLFCKLIFIVQCNHTKISHDAFNPANLSLISINCHQFIYKLLRFCSLL